MAKMQYDDFNCRVDILADSGLGGVAIFSSEREVRIRDGFNFDAIVTYTDRTIAEDIGFMLMAFARRQPAWPIYALLTGAESATTQGEK